MKIKGIEIDWLGHAGFMLNIKEKVIYIDPFRISGKLPKADYVLITHSHYDHCSIEDLMKIVEDGTTVIMAADCQSKLMKIDKQIDMKVAQPGVKYKLDGFDVECIEAYNIGKTFHEKIQGWVGYIIKTDDVVVYHAGDTDIIPEQQKLKSYANNLIMLVPVGGTYTMDWKEASELVKDIKPFLAIPMHYGTIVGSSDDANNFVKECTSAGLNAMILEKRE